MDIQLNVQFLCAAFIEFHLLIKSFSLHKIFFYFEQATKKESLGFEDDDFEMSGSDFDDDEDPDKIEVPGLLKFILFSIQFQLTKSIS